MKYLLIGIFLMLLDIAPLQAKNIFDYVDAVIPPSGGATVVFSRLVKIDNPRTLVIDKYVVFNNTSGNQNATIFDVELVVDGKSVVGYHEQNMEFSIDFPRAGEYAVKYHGFCINRDRPYPTPEDIYEPSEKMLNTKMCEELEKIKEKKWGKEKIEKTLRRMASYVWNQFDDKLENANDVSYAPGVDK